MTKYTLVLIAIVSSFIFSCSQNESILANPELAKVDLILQSSNKVRDTSSISDDVGKAVTFFIKPYLSYHILSISLNIGLDSSCVFENRQLNDDTIPIVHKFKLAGTHIITMIAQLRNGQQIKKTDTVKIGGISIIDTTFNGLNPPSNIAVTSLSSISLQIQWNLIGSATGYKVYRSSTAGGNYLEIGSYNADDWRFYPSAFIDTGLLQKTTYYYKVKAVYLNGVSDFSSPAIGTTKIPETVAPSLPTAISIIPKSSKSVEISWEFAPNATKYIIYRTLGTELKFEAIDTTALGKFIDTNLNASTKYTYKMKALNKIGTSDFSALTSVFTLQGPPLPPSSVNITIKTSKSMQLTWSVVPAAEIFKVFKSFTGSAGSFIQIGSSTSTAYTDTGLTANTTYYYSVKSVNQSGESGFSSTATGVTSN